MKDQNELRVAFVAGLSDYKLSQKLMPLAGLDAVAGIDLFRRQPFQGTKVVWQNCPGFFGIKLLQELHRGLDLILHSNRYDLVVGCHMTYHGVWAWLATKFSGKKLVQVVITDVEWVLAKPLARRALLNADVAAVRGENGREKLERAGFSKPIHVLHNPYKLPEKTEGELSIKYDVICVGSLAKEKAHDWGLTVCRHLVEEDPNVKIGIVGAGVEHLRGLVQTLDLTDHVELLGELEPESLSLLYRQAKLLFLGSSVEGLPMVVVEAMSHGLPVCVTDVGELNRVVQHESNGMLFPFGDTLQAGECILKLLRDDNLRLLLGANARKRMEDMSTSFSVESVQQVWRDILTDAFADGNT